MQFLNVLLLATAVYSQSLSSIVAQIPSCALTCLATGAAAAGCGVSDYACQCGEKRAAITSSATPCVLGQCAQAEALTVLSVINQICAAVGSSAPSSAAPAATTTPATKTATSGAAVTTSVPASSFQSVSVKPTAASTTSSFVQVPSNPAMRLKAGAGVVGGALLMAMAL